MKTRDGRTLTDNDTCVFRYWLHTLLPLPTPSLSVQDQGDLPKTYRVAGAHVQVKFVASGGWGGRLGDAECEVLKILVRPDALASMLFVLPIE